MRSFNIDRNSFCFLDKRRAGQIGGVFFLKAQKLVNYCPYGVDVAILTFVKLVILILALYYNWPLIIA